MQLIYTQFYKQFGLRRIQNLLAPRLFILSSLPRDSMLHYVSHDAEHPNIDISQLYLKNIQSKIYVDYPDTLTELKGFPKKKNTVLRMLTKDFHRENKKYFYLHNAYESITASNVVLINNYSYLDVIYRYLEMPMVSYNRWWNTQKTVWDTIQAIADNCSRHHFVFTKIPDEIPSLSLLQFWSTKTNPTLLKIFTTVEQLFLLELWKWLNRETRSLSALSNIKVNNYSKINIVFQLKDGRCSVLNLGYLNSWIKGELNQTEFNSLTSIQDNQLQKLFLKFVLTLQSSVPEAIIADNVTPETSEDTTQTHTDREDAEEQQEFQEEFHDYDSVHDESEDHDGGDEQIYSPELITNSPKALTSTKEDKHLTNELTDSTVDITKQLKNIDNDISVLEKMNQFKLKERGIHFDKHGQLLEMTEVEEPEMPLEEIQNTVFSTKPSEQILKDYIDTSAEYGLLSAADYKKALKDIDASLARLDPYGSGKLVSEHAKISKAEIEINEDKKTIVASENVLDKSMLQSSLQSFDYDYLTKVITKDTLGMINEVQKSGVIIRKHEVEIDRSALGDYENHTLELKPIDGQSSILRFRIPKISEDGTFVANGNKYIMRKQRIDLPIRKINPITVALTSYYGKTFVALSSKKANSSVEWIVKQLNKATIEDHPYITKVAPGMVFDNNFKAPFIYNALAHQFKSIHAGKYKLIFDHTDREHFVEDAVRERLEKDGAVIVGLYEGRYPVLVKEDNSFWVFNQKDLVSVGNIYDVLQLEENNAPVDFAEVRIFSKTIPVGVILAYSIGLNNLIKLLKTSYRTVEARKQLNLEREEYALRFQDQTLIFSRKDRIASMILAGFNEYEKQLKQYPLKEFNQKNVYLNLLESKGLGSLYIREIELTQQLFVDSITKSILEEMNEPVTFNGLLIRSCEMLQYYHHPDTQDTKAQRIRGYERIPGVVYKELVASLRQFRNRNIAGKSKMEMSPYQVWSVIMKDPAIKLVEDINPIQNLKESEVVTYVGEGGRAKDSMNKASRAYHPNDIGIVSEATVDSSDVGVNAYLSADPKFKDLRGIIKDDPKVTSANIISTSALLAPGASQDD